MHASNSGTHRNTKPMRRLEVVDFFGVSKATIDNWVRAGILQKIKIGGLTYFDRQQVHQLAQRRSHE